MNRKFITIAITLSLILIIFSGCNSLINELKNSEMDTASEQVIKDIINNNYNNINNYFHTELGHSININQFATMHNTIKGEFVSLNAVNIQISKNSTNNKITNIYNVTYKLTTTEDEYNLTTQWVEDDNGKGFTIFTLDNNIVNSNNGNNVLNIILKIFSLLMIIFGIISIVICLKSNMKKKWIYAFIIFLLYTGITIQYGNNGFHFDFNFIFAYMSGFHKTFDNSILTINIPLGVIIFWIVKNKETNKENILKILTHENNTNDNSEITEKDKSYNGIDVEDSDIDFRKDTDKGEIDNYYK